MLIKYVKDGVTGKAGDVQRVNPMQGRVLIKLGIAKIHDPKPARKPKERQPKQGEAFGNLPKEVSGDDKDTGEITE